MQEQINSNQQQKEQTEQQTHQAKKSKPKAKAKRGAYHQAGVQSGSDDTTIRARQKPFKARQKPFKAKHLPIDRRKHRSDLPAKLANNIEQMTGVSLEGVKVIRDSLLPLEHQAEALAMDGKEIHLARGQEEHLPEEAAHIARQRQGGVTSNKGQLNTQSHIEAADRKLGMEANLSPWIEGSRDGLMSGLPSTGIIQRHEALLNIIDNNEVKDLAKEAMLSLLNKYKDKYGPKIIDDLLILITNAADTLIVSGAGKLLDMFAGGKGMGESIGKWVSLAYTWYNKIKDVHERYALPVTVLKYIAGRALVSGVRRLTGYELPHTWVTKAMQTDDAIIMLLQKLEDLAGKWEMIAKPIKLLSNDFYGKKARAQKITETIRNHVNGHANQEFNAENIAALLKEKHASEEDQEFITHYVLPILEKKHGKEGKPADASEIQDTLRQVDQIFETPPRIGSYLLVQSVWKNWLSYKLGAEGKEIGEWIVGTSSPATTVTTVTGVGLIAGGIYLIPSHPWLGGVIAGVGAATVIGSKIYDYYYSPDANKREKETTPDEASENRKENTGTADAESGTSTEKEKDKKSANQVAKSINTKFFWMNLHEAKIKKWQNADTEKQTGGASIDFGIGFNLFGKKLFSSNDHQLKLDWGGGFDYKNSEIKLIDGKLGFDNAFTIQNVSLKDIHMTNEGLKTLRIEFNQVRIADGIVNVKQIGGKWDKTKGFTFNAEATAMISGNSVTGEVDFGLTKEGKFREGHLRISNDNKKPIELLPGTLDVIPEELDLRIGEDKKFSGWVKVGANLNTEHVKLKTNTLTLGYDNGWSFTAPNIEGQIILPEKKTIDLTLAFKAKDKKIAGDFTAKTNALNNLVPNVFGIDNIGVKGGFDQENKTWYIGVDAAAHLVVADKRFSGALALMLGSKGFEGKVNINLDDEIPIVPDMLVLSGAGFEGGLNIEENKPIDFSATISASTKLNVNNMLKLDAQNMHVSYSHKTRNWEIGATSLSGELFNLLYARLDDTSFNFNDKKFKVGKLTVGLHYSKGNDKFDKVNEEEGLGLANILEVLKLVKNFETEVAYDNLSMDMGIGKGEKLFKDGIKPNSWAFKELEIEYMGFGARLSLKDGNISGGLKAGYSTNITLFTVGGDIPIPAAPGLNLVAELNVVAPVKLGADVGMTFVGDRSSTEKEEYFFMVDGNMNIEGGVFLEAVLGASVGAGALASIGGQLFGRAGAKANIQAGAKAGFMYDGKEEGLKNKFKAGPKKEDKFAFNVDSSFNPNIQFGGRLVAKLLGKQFNLFEYKFVDWDFGGSARIVFSIAMNDSGEYAFEIDENLSKIGEKTFKERSLEGLVGNSLNDTEHEEHKELEKYDVLRHAVSDAERALKAEDKELYNEKLNKIDSDVNGVEQALIELLAKLEIQKGELESDLKTLAFMKSKVSFGDGFKSFFHLGEFDDKEARNKLEDAQKAIEELEEEFEKKGIKDKAEDAQKAIKKLEHEIPKVMLLNRDSETAVKLLQKRRETVRGKVFFDTFKIWDDLAETIAAKRAGLSNVLEDERTSVDKKKVQEKTDELKEELKIEMNERTKIMIRKIKEAKSDKNKENG